MLKVDQKTYCSQTVLVVAELPAEVVVVVVVVPVVVVVVLGQSMARVERYGQSLDQSLLASRRMPR